MATRSADEALLRTRLERAIQFRESLQSRCHRLPPRARRGRSAAVARGRSIRRLPRRAGAVAGHGSAPAGDHVDSCRPAAAGGDPRAERSEGARRSKGSSRRSTSCTARFPTPSSCARGRSSTTSTCARGRRPGSFSISARTARPRRATRAGGCSIVSATTAGFALRLARTCPEAEALDISADAVERIRANAIRNGVPHLQAREANVFDELRRLERAGARYDTIVLDPPAFAKNKASVPNAMAGYKEINLRAMRLLNPGGYLVTCSCSYNVNEDMFAEVIHAGVDRQPHAGDDRREADAGARSPGARRRARDVLPEVLHPAPGGMNGRAGVAFTRPTR